MAIRTKTDPVDLRRLQRDVKAEAARLRAMMFAHEEAAAALEAIVNPPAKRVRRRKPTEVRVNVGQGTYQTREL